MIKAHDVSSIVVRAPNWVGDAVMSVAALRELRGLFPNSHITVVSKPGTAEVFAGADYIDTCWFTNARFEVIFRSVQKWKQRSSIWRSSSDAFEAAAFNHGAGRCVLDTRLNPLASWSCLLSQNEKNERHENFIPHPSRTQRLLTAPPEPSADFGISVSDNKSSAKALIAKSGTRNRWVCSARSQRRASVAAERYAALADHSRTWSDGRTDWRADRIDGRKRRCDEPAAGSCLRRNQSQSNLYHQASRC